MSTECDRSIGRPVEFASGARGGSEAIAILKEPSTNAAKPTSGADMGPPPITPHFGVTFGTLFLPLYNGKYRVAEPQKAGPHIRRSTMSRFLMVF